MIIQPVTSPSSGWSVDKAVVPADYLKTRSADLVLGHRSSDLELLNLVFAGFSW
jgi:hypothetical protein